MTYYLCFLNNPQWLYLKGFTGHFLTQNIKADSIADTVGYIVTDVSRGHKNNEGPEGKACVEARAGQGLTVEIYKCTRYAGRESPRTVVRAVNRIEVQWYSCIHQ